MIKSMSNSFHLLEKGLKHLCIFGLWRVIQRGADFFQLTALRGGKLRIISTEG